MRPLLVATFLSVLCFGVLACASSESDQEEEQPRTSAIREYVNTPKDKARGAKRRLEGAQKRAAEQANSLADDQ